MVTPPNAHALKKFVETLFNPDNRVPKIDRELEVFKPAQVHFCTDFTSTVSAPVSTYGRVVLRRGTLVQPVKVLEVFKPAQVHFCTDFTSTVSATVSTYGRVVLRRGTLVQTVKVVQDSHLLNTHPYPQPSRATIPNRHSFAGKYLDTLNQNKSSPMLGFLS
ncbi:hypothetical protein RF11_16236 [Thelohanellus kitauei]|uniref:Uncharacterized protein n=1 Tax=Thelohanellus kitauei TaxID=669202 RepID=A0A0C2MLB6_THEKT|nr:hypothetical protein RF11_16236 [Thelohanellus kitauei]